MKINLDGQVAIITGGGRDIGRSISTKLARCGASVVVNYRSSEAEAKETTDAINEAGGHAISVQADVTDPEQVDRLVEETRDEFGKDIHILVNNAGGLIARRTMDEMDEAFWHKVMDVNLTSVFLVTKAVLSYMADNGSIINLSSLAAHSGGGNGAIAYATSKGAVMTMTRGLAKELGARRIRVNAVTPGLIDTTFHDRFTPDEGRKRTAQGLPLGREGKADEVGDTVAYLASDLAAYVNGASLEINGGLHFS